MSTYVGVTGVSQPRRTSRTLTLPSPAASHRLAAPPNYHIPTRLQSQERTLTHKHEGRGSDRTDNPSPIRAQ
jgi:hypothetical protein